MNKILNYYKDPLGTSLEDLIEIYIYAKKMYYDGTPILTDPNFDCLENLIKRKDPDNNALNIIGGG